MRRTWMLFQVVIKPGPRIAGKHEYIFACFKFRKFAGQAICKFCGDFDRCSLWVVKIHYHLAPVCVREELLVNLSAAYSGHDYKN